MAIALDSVTTVQTSGSSSLTFSHTCTGSNLILFVISTANGSQTTTGVTYNGVALTKIGERTDSNGPTQYLWYLINPSTGANNVVITNSGSATAGSAASYTGVAQSSPIDANTTTAETNTTSFATSITTVADNCWIICTSRTGSGLTLTAGANTAVRSQPEQIFFGGAAFWDSNSAQTPPGSKTVTVTCSNQFFGGAVIASFKPASASSSILTASGIAQANIKTANGIAIADIKTISGIVNQ